MNNIYYDFPDHPHFDEYRYGCCLPHHPIPGPHPCPPPPCPHPCPPPPYFGKVGIIGKLVLSVKYIDAHGHTQYFDIVPGETYIIEAVSQVKGRCKFTGRIVDFDTKRGTEQVLTAPHIVDISAIIVDYSDDYEAKVIKVGVDNIISIKPIEKIESACPNEFCPEEYYIDDPFANQSLEYSISKAELEQRKR